MKSSILQKRNLWLSRSLFFLSTGYRNWTKNSIGDICWVSLTKVRSCIHPCIKPPSSSVSHAARTQPYKSQAISGVLGQILLLFGGGTMVPSLLHCNLRNTRGHAWPTVSGIDFKDLALPINQLDSKSSLKAQLDTFNSMKRHQQFLKCLSGVFSNLKFEMIRVMMIDSQLHNNWGIPSSVIDSGATFFQARKHRLGCV